MHAMRYASFYLASNELNNNVSHSSNRHLPVHRAGKAFWDLIDVSVSVAFLLRCKMYIRKIPFRRYYYTKQLLQIPEKSVLILTKYCASLNWHLHLIIIPFCSGHFLNPQLYLLFGHCIQWLRCWTSVWGDNFSYSFHTYFYYNLPFSRCVIFKPHYVVVLLFLKWQNNFLYGNTWHVNIDTSYQAVRN